MSIGENNSIRYLMKEMDPSEVLEFEKWMRSDNDLLIEVESLRATQRKTTQLPLKNPPESLIQNIVHEATQIQKSRIDNSKKVYKYVRKGIAAAILLSAITGAFYFYSAEDYSPNEIMPVANETMLQSGDKQSITPWVDRNEVLRYASETPAATESFDTERLKSLEKLQLINNQISGRDIPGIHLTGSPN